MTSAALSEKCSMWYFFAAASAFVKLFDLPLLGDLPRTSLVDSPEDVLCRVRRARTLPCACVKCCARLPCATLCAACVTLWPASCAACETLADVVAALADGDGQASRWAREKTVVVA